MAEDPRDVGDQQNDEIVAPLERDPESFEQEDYKEPRVDQPIPADDVDGDDDRTDLDDADDVDAEPDDVAGSLEPDPFAIEEGDGVSARLEFEVEAEFDDEADDGIEDDGEPPNEDEEIDPDESDDESEELDDAAVSPDQQQDGARLDTGVANAEH